MIVGIGRLTRQKDFPTLIRAFAAVRKKLPCRLIILGEGKDRGGLEHLAKRLSLSEQIAMPGFVENPYAYLKRAALFVLSSAWEGSPNALTEALALGVPVVATDCPSGPREILKDGAIGCLVPVGDPDALAAAMLATLSAPPDETLLKSAVREYTVECQQPAVSGPAARQNSAVRTIRRRKGLPCCYCHCDTIFCSFTLPKPGGPASGRRSTGIVGGTRTICRSLSAAASAT